MAIADLTISAAQLAAGAEQWQAPIAFIDLSQEAPQPAMLHLPPCPVVGIGNDPHPLSAGMDMLIPSHQDGEAVARAVADQPLAAAVSTQLLRLLPALDPVQGLIAESLAYAVLQGSAAHRAWISARQGRQDAPLPTGRVELDREDGTLLLTLDRAAAGNAIDRSMRDGLYEALALANADSTISRVVLRARGKTFSLGAELGEFGTTADPATAHAIRCATLPAHQAVRCADRLAVEIDGACVGAGLELAAFASRISATRRSWFQLPELAMGILPGAGGCVSLTRRIGRQRTLEMILSGRRLSARQALAWGLIDAIVDDSP